MNKRRIRIAVLGASGYTGGELLRLLAGHPYAAVTIVTADKSAGRPVSSLFPNLTSYYSLTCETLDTQAITKKADLIFAALPHTQSMEPVSFCAKQGKIVIDLSADYRLRNPETYQTWYHVPHSATALLKTAVYGLPELHRTAITKARVVAVPGCYPTAAILQLAPLMARKLLQPGSIVIDAKSGISGAGRSPALPYHFPESHESLKGYKIGEHRHIPEIEQELNAISRRRSKSAKPSSVEETVTFTPHLVPLNRGILSTAYGRLSNPTTLKTLRGLYDTFYKHEPFIRVQDDVMAISPNHVRGSNFCDLGIFLNERTGHIVTVAAIDNLIKGAAGQAIQCMNLIMGYPENTGLANPPLYP